MPGPCANVALAHHCKPSAQYGADSHPESLSLPRVLPLSRQGKALSKAMQSIIRFLDSRRQIRSPSSEHLVNVALRPRLRQQKNGKLQA